MAEKKSPTHVALLRGINVGGKNIIPMVELRDCFAQTGFQDVQTYIQSGNVLFRAKSKSIKNMTKKIEDALSDRFDYSARAVVLSKISWHANLKCAHRNWGERTGYKHNAMFAIDGLDVAAVFKKLPPLKKSIETVSYGNLAIFWSTNIEKASQTTMMKLAKSPAYKHLTVRNHKTVFKLTEMLSL